ncbi:MAG: hypothetical protein JOZ86_04385 [Candidatus Eremiobacteraeota bacterium]|nr:hypothetical protein [Candidatus Eremiobacteraeota bacterium]
MLARFRFAAAFALALMVVVPAAAHADDDSGSPTTMTLNFVPPKGWTDDTRPNNRPGLWRDWVIRDGATVHSIVLSVTREKLTAIPLGEAAVAFFKLDSAVSQVTGGPATVCGDVPAFRYQYRSDRTAGHPLVIVHVLVDVGTFLGDVSYAWPAGGAPRADALDALTTMCEQRIYAMRAPAGWRGSDVLASGPHIGVQSFVAPTGHGALVALAVSEPASDAAKMLAPAVANAGGTVLSDGEETCGAIRVRHTRMRVLGKDTDGPGIIEEVAGYRHGASYVYTYVRPEAEAADPLAQRALTSFCATDAVLATPAPFPTAGAAPTASAAPMPAPTTSP